MSTSKPYMSVKPVKGGREITVRTPYLYGKVVLLEGSSGRGTIKDEYDKTVGTWDLTQNEPPKPSNYPCTHLGDEVDRVKCESCKGLVLVKVFQCMIHGKCTIAKKLPGVDARCPCSDYNPMKPR